MNIFEVLLNKAREQKLGHFYILETSAPAEAAQEKLINFVHDFIRDYYHKIEGHKMSISHLMDHPDVYVIGNLNESDEKSDKFFKVEEAESFARFFEFRPVQGTRKFAVITEGHRINATVANKWLKLLEEPQGTSTIFLLNPRGGQLLPTIHSRAIHLRLPITVESGKEEFSHLNDLVRDLKIPFSEFLEKYRDQNISYWINELIRWESQQTGQAETKEKFVHWLRDFQEMETFHQPTATKWALFHSYLTQVPTHFWIGSAE